MYPLGLWIYSIDILLPIGGTYLICFRILEVYLQERVIDTLLRLQDLCINGVLFLLGFLVNATTVKPKEGQERNNLLGTLPVD